jgi:hypothetical protein
MPYKRISPSFSPNFGATPNFRIDRFNREGRANADAAPTVPARKITKPKTLPNAATLRKVNAVGNLDAILAPGNSMRIRSIPALATAALTTGLVAMKPYTR